MKTIRKKKTEQNFKSSSYTVTLVNLYLCKGLTQYLIHAEFLLESFEHNLSGA